MNIEQSTMVYKADLKNLLKNDKLPEITPSRLYCSQCDPRFKLLSSPEKVRNNLLLEKQLRFRPDINRIEFRRDFKPNYEYLNPLLWESKFSTQKLGQKLRKFPVISQELDYRFEVDVKDHKLYFKDDYLKANNIQDADFPCQGFLPTMLALNPNSSSTSIRLVITPNRAGYPRF